MKKKVLSVLLSTAMVASMLVGCGGGSGETTPAAPAADNSGSQDTASSGDAAHRQPAKVLRKLPGCSGTT